MCKTCKSYIYSLILLIFFTCTWKFKITMNIQSGNFKFENNFNNNQGHSFQVNRLYSTHHSL